VEKFLHAAATKSGNSADQISVCAVETSDRLEVVSPTSTKSSQLRIIDAKRNQRNKLS